MTAGDLSPSEPTPAPNQVAICKTAPKWAPRKPQPNPLILIEESMSSGGPDRPRPGPSPIKFLI
jgi:hypothetical protein